MIGQRIGSYTIVEKSARAGWASSTRDRQPPARDVAVKFLPEPVERPTDHCRFEREAKVLASLNHPGIATIHGLQESGGRFLVMELVPGNDLAGRITRGNIPLKKPCHRGGDRRGARGRARTRHHPS